MSRVDHHRSHPRSHMICVMRSDFATKATGEVIHVDVGFHAVAT